MLIAIDFDKTFTADPDLWVMFAGMVKTKGHDCIIVTRRHSNDPIPMTSNDLLWFRGVVYAGNKLKRQEAEKAGYLVDIWIDDTPGSIEPCTVLDWSS